MRSRVHPRGRARIAANLTPLIDVAFLLIVFFVLVTRIGEPDPVRIDLPRPVAPRTQIPEEPVRLAVTLVPRHDDPAVLASIRAVGTSFAPDREGRDLLAARLSELYAADPALRLDLRADRRLQYRFVEPVLRAVADAAASAGAAPRVNLVVLREHGS